MADETLHEPIGPPAAVHEPIEDPVAVMASPKADAVPQPAAAPSPKAPPAPGPKAVVAHKIVEHWVDKHLRNSPIARDTPAWNHLMGSLAALKAIIEQEV